MFYDPASLGDGLDGAITPNNGKKRGRPPAAVWNNFTGVGEVKSSTKRRPACCNFCKHLIVDSRVEALLKHIVRDCTKTTPEARQQADIDLQARNDAAAAAAAAGPTAPGSKVKIGGPKAKPGQTLALAQPGGQVGNAGVESRELRFLLLHDLPLAVADSPALLDLVRALRPRHGLADANRLRSTVVNDEYGKMLANATKSVASATCVTLAASNTVLVGHQHVLGCSVHLADKTSTLLHVLEAPSDAFAPGELFAVLKDTIERFGPERVAAVVSDGTMSLRGATQQLVTTDQYTHMLQLRCHAQALGEVLAACLSHSWAQSLILDAHNLVLHINNSTELLSVMLQAVGADADATTMLPPITESFSSVYPSLSALLTLESAIRLLLQHHQVALANPETKALLLNFSSANLGVLMELLEQFQRAIDAIENRKAPLADLTRYWIYIARTLDALRSRCPGGFVEHCELAYQRSASQLDSEICRLALFLDPRFKLAADTGRSFPKLLQNAVDMMKKRGHGKEECQQLISQLQQYKAGISPYDLPCGGDNFNLQAWWLSLMAPATTVLVGLAILMTDILPYAAFPNDVMSALGWFPHFAKDPVTGSLGCKLAILKAYYASEPSPSSDPGHLVKTESGGAPHAKPWEPAETGVERDGLARVLQRWQARFATDGMGQQSMPFTGVLFSSWDGIDTQSPYLDPKYVPQDRPGAQAIGGLGSFTDNDFDAAQLVQQYTMGNNV